jgi:hypothetical protein
MQKFDVLKNFCRVDLVWSGEGIGRSQRPLSEPFAPNVADWPSANGWDRGA